MSSVLIDVVNPVPETKQNLELKVYPEEHVHHVD
jgi:hypothetical protein